MSFTPRNVDVPDEASNDIILSVLFEEKPMPTTSWQRAHTQNEPENEEEYQAMEPALGAEPEPEDEDSMNTGSLAASSQDVPNTAKILLEMQEAHEHAIDCMQRMLVEVQEAEQTVREAQKDAFEVEISLTHEKLEASLEENQALESSCVMLKDEMQKVECERRNLDSELRDLRIQQRKAKLDTNKRELAALQAARQNDLERKANKEAQKKHAGEIKTLRSELVELQQSNRQQQMQLEESKQALDEAVAHAEEQGKEVKAECEQRVQKATAELQASEEKRKQLIIDIEAGNAALDAANARAATFQSQARDAKSQLKLEMVKAEKQRMELEASFQLQLEESEQKQVETEARSLEYLESARNKIEEAHARANKYKEAAWKLKGQVEKMRQPAKKAAAAVDDHFYNNCFSG